ncbi:hypothetical protein [Pseudoduganella sp. UC29_71]|uniref:hypothetical protein n=1 Tax=Pseudoduganella sp. UC29_71 TaxID=3350174 RepID=UPI003673540D
MGSCLGRDELVVEADDAGEDDGCGCMPCFRSREQAPLLPPVVTARLCVQVLLWQDQAVAIAGASVTLDNAVTVLTADHGDGIYADFGQRPRGPHQLQVRRAAPDPLVIMARLPLPPVAYIARTANWNINLAADLQTDVYVDQCLRLRLGHATAVTGANTGEHSWLRCWLPAVTAAGATPAYRTWFDIAASAGVLHSHGDAPGNPAAPAPASATVAPAAAGWRYFRFSGAAAANVTTALAEQGFAREAAAFNAAPIIPWNFYFWSVSRAMTWDDVHQDFRVSATKPVAFLRAQDADNAGIDYVFPDGQAFAISNPHGISPFEAFDAHFGLPALTSAMAWEQDPLNISHNDLGNVLPNPNTWEGHCNMMCAASIVFAEPVTTLAFDAEHLKLFAAEFAANTVATQNVWTLPDPVCRVAPVTAVPTVGDLGWRTAQKLGLARDLGAAGLTLLGALRTYLGQRGLPLLTDMRASYNAQNVRGSADEVWNQVVFKYHVRFQEHALADATHAADDRKGQDLELALSLYANADGELPTMTMPGQLVGNDVVHTPASCWQRTVVLRLQFINAGQPGADNLNTCTSCVNVGAECYLPRYLAPVSSVTAAVGAGEGNPHITLARLQDPGLNLQFRARYAPPFNEVLP